MANQKTEDLKNRIMEIISSTTPIKSSEGVTLSVEDVTFEEPKELSDIYLQTEMKYQGKKSLTGNIKGRIVIRAKNGSILSKGGIMNLVPIPCVTDRDTYIINGVEKNILSQLRLKPGSYTNKVTQSSEVKTNIMFDNNVGSSYVPPVVVKFSPITNDFKITVGGKKKENFNGINFLRNVGFKDAEILNMMGNDYVADAVMSKYDKRENKNINTVYKAFTGKTSTETPDKTKLMLEDYLKENAKFGSGESTIKDSLDVDSSYLNKDVLFKAVKKTFGVSKNEVNEDDKDDLRFKDVYDDNDFIIEEFKKDWDMFLDKSKAVLATSSNNINYTDIRAVTKLNKSIDKFFSSSDLVQTPEETNPLFMSALSRKITQLGTGGMSSDAARNEFSARNLATGSAGRIDPVETPESGNIGLVQHMTQNAEIINKTIVAKYFRVKNGIASTDESNVVKLTPSQEYNEKIAFYDTRNIKKANGKIGFVKGMVACRYKGEIDEFPITEITYMDTSPTNILGYTSNMVPFVSHNDGSRTLMGDAMQKQAIVLKNREAPIVSTMYDDDKSYEDVLGEKFGKPVKSNVNGTIEKIENNKIFIKDDKGVIHKNDYYHYFPLNQSYINNELKVKVGDTVKQGDMLAEGWQTKDGKLALGLNARIGYIPYKGYNYEDGIVISESFARKMVTEEVDDQIIDIPKGWKGGRGSNVLREIFDGGYSTKGEIRSNLDADGIIKVGTYVKAGSILAACLRPLPDRKDKDVSISDLVKISSKMKYVFEPLKISSSSYAEGKVERIMIVTGQNNSSSQQIVVTLSVSKPLKIGDKIAGRHGNKGTITKILSDDVMPVAQDGKPIEVMYSPLAIPSRKNLGQLFEVNAGLIAEKTGKKFNLQNFNHNEKEKVLNGLKEIGVSDGKMNVTLKERQADGTILDIKTENPVTVGNMYMMKLKHKVDDKIQSRSNIETPVSNKTHMPSKLVGSGQGEMHNPQSLGEMEMRALQAHGAVWNVLENSTIKSDGGGGREDRIALFNAIANNDFSDLQTSTTPESLNVLSDSLKALGLKMRPMQNGKDVESFNEVYNGMGLDMMKSSEILKIIGKGKEVTQPKLFNIKNIEKDEPKSKSNSKKSKNTAEDDVAYPGGLMDESIFGTGKEAEDRQKWGYVKLATPIPNPIFMKNREYNPYSILTNRSIAELQALTNGKKVIIIDPKKYSGFESLPADVRKGYIEEVQESIKKAGYKPGQLVDPKELQTAINTYGEILWKAGGEGIQDLLDKVDLNESIETAKKDLDSAKGDNIDIAYKRYKVLLNLKEKGMQPSDLMMHYVPVAPLYLRPISKGKDDKKTIIRDDLNDLYANLIKANSPLAKVSAETGFDLYKTQTVENAAKVSANIYKRLSDITGETQGKDIKTGKELRGIKSALGNKEGLIRGSMLGKRVDFSGRSVIGVDPELNIDEVGIPLDMAKYLYRPFIIKDLVSKGYAASTFKASKKWEKLDDDTKEVINEIAKDRPVILNRQPSLHKFSIQAFKPIIKEKQDGEVVRSIHLNPLVVTGFNADFDGDQMSVHVPITEAAKNEAKNIMMPSENLINPTNGSMVVEIRHEMLLGIYYLTIKNKTPEGNGIMYSNYFELRKDYKEGKLGARTKVTIDDAVNVTAGEAMFNLLLPKQYRDYKKVWGNKEVKGVLMKMYKDAEDSDWKTMSKTELSAIIDKVKTLGFEAATRSGVSLGVGDFKNMSEAEGIFQKHLNESGKKFASPKDALINGWREAEKEIESKLKDGKVLSDDNPLQIMMASGARAKADQIRRMMVSVGVGMDVNKRLISPVKNSHFDGLSPQDFFKIGYDSRKGVLDRSVNTKDPGTLTREVWAATQDIVIKEVDCGSKDGIMMNKGDKNLLGRYALEDIIGSSGKIICRRGQLINDFIYREIYADNDISKVAVRSPLKCKTVGGMCQKCYGSMAGTIYPPKLGTAVGILASQAMGEPVTQMTMNTFHSGGTSSNATLGLPRIKAILNLKEDIGNNAVLAKTTGTVLRVESGKLEDTVYVNGVAHKVPHLSNGESQKLKVKIGDTVVKGDFLTPGDLTDIANAENSNNILTNADPKNLFKLKSSVDGFGKGLDYVQNYLTNSMEYAFDKTIGQGNIDNKHIEVIVGKMTSEAVVTDPGDSNFFKGQIVSKNELDAWNRDNASVYGSKTVPIGNSVNIVGKTSAVEYKDKKGIVIVNSGAVITPTEYSKLMLSGHKSVKVNTKPITYEPRIYSKQSVVTKGHDNWFSNLGTQDVYKQLARGTTMGQVDKMEDPRSRLMSGKLLNIGEGFDVAQNFANGISHRMFDMFSKIKIPKK